MKNLLLKNQFEALLQSHWTKFLDHTQLLKVILEFTRDSTFPTSKESIDISQQMKITITKVAIVEQQFELWIEFTIPKDTGLIIGTYVCSLNLNGDFHLKKSYGTHFMAESQTTSKV